jgi:hypothetical protein
MNLYDKLRKSYLKQDIQYEKKRRKRRKSNKKFQRKCIREYISAIKKHSNDGEIQFRNIISCDVISCRFIRRYHKIPCEFIPIESQTLCKGHLIFYWNK